MPVTFTTLSRSVLSAATLLCLAASCLAQPLNGELHRLLNKDKLTPSQVGISVLDLGVVPPTGEPFPRAELLGDIESTRPMTPASNQKVLTTATALWTLGKDFSFRTELRLSGDRLIIKGDGDPSFADPEILGQAESKLTTDQFMDTLAGAVAKAGVTQLSEIVIDDRIFDRMPYHPQLPARHRGTNYCTPISGVTFHANLLALFAKPGGRGSAPTIRIEPGLGFIEIDNKGESTTDSTNTIVVRPVGDERLEVSGRIGTPNAGPVECPMNDPATIFGKSLAERLALLQIKIGGTPNTRAGANKLGVEAVRLVDANESFEAPRTLAVVTTPLADVVRHCNTVSQNMYADSLLKRAGASVTKEPGSWDNGTAVVRMTLSQKLGPDYARATVISDGSGLSESNRVAPGTLTKWLQTIASDREISDTFISSLATPSEGTLKHRFGKAGLKNQLQAKTGYVNGVLCLSGYLTSPKTNRRVAFSLMCNNVAKGDALTNAVELQKDFVKSLDSWLSKQSGSLEPMTSGGER